MSLLDFLEIEEDGTCRINGKEKYSFKISLTITQAELEALLFAKCSEFEDVEYGSEPTVKKVVREAMESLESRKATSQSRHSKTATVATLQQEVAQPDTSSLGHSPIQSLQTAIVENEKPIDTTYKVGNMLLQQYKFKTYADTKEMLRYDHNYGYWTKDGAVFIESLIKSNGLKLSKHQISEVLYHVQTSSYVERSNFVGAIDGNLLHVSNGWLNMDTLDLSPHTSEKLSTSKIPTAFDRNAGPVEFTRMINAALPEPEYRLRLCKVMGNLLVSDARYEKATLLVGEGHNRKGSIIFGVHSVLGKENCCSVSLQELSEDRFATADFYGKMANIVADLSNQKVTYTGRFKELVSGDFIRAQEKHRPSFHFSNYAKFIYSTNEIPPSVDQTNAYMRRWEIIPFYISFDRDPTLQVRLRAPNEMSGILNLMLWGRRLLIKEGFDEVSIERVRFLYNQNASAAKDFITQECVIDFNQDDFKTRTDTLQEAYVMYSIEKKHKKKKDREALIRQLGEELRKLGIENRQRGPRNVRDRYYIGIRLKSEINKVQTELQ